MDAATYKRRVRGSIAARLATRIPGVKQAIRLEIASDIAEDATQLYVTVRTEDDKRKGLTYAKPRTE